MFILVLGYEFGVLKFVFFVLRMVINVDDVEVVVKRFGLKFFFR